MFSNTPFENWKGCLGGIAAIGWSPRKQKYLVQVKLMACLFACTMQREIGFVVFSGGEMELVPIELRIMELMLAACGEA